MIDLLKILCKTSNMIKEENKLIEIQLRQLSEKVDVLIDQMRKLTTQDDRKIMTIKDIADRLGVAVGTVYRNKYVLPNYGEGMTGGQKATWTKREVDAWLEEMPLQQRKEEYLALGMGRAKRTLVRQ